WLAGSLCTREHDGAKEWLAELASESGAAGSAPDGTLAALAQESLSAFRAEEFAFAPLLPPDDAPLAERVAALATWCEGFLYGVGAGSPDPAVAQAGEVGEFLRDLADISRAELEPGRADEAGEADLAELIEFVRAGAQLTFDELAGARAHAQG
ncbi:MAG: UPF0149 family protein, partial [Steroidobacteraceae bacterium]